MVIAHTFVPVVMDPPIVAMVSYSAWLAMLPLTLDIVLICTIVNCVCGPTCHCGDQCKGGTAECCPCTRQGINYIYYVINGQG